MNHIKADKCGRIQMNIPIGAIDQALGNQEFLRDKNVKGIFVSGATTGKNGGTNTNTGFYLTLFASEFTIADLPAGQFLNFNNQNIWDMCRNDIDWPRSLVTFPAALVAAAQIEFIVFYDEVKR